MYVGDFLILFWRYFFGFLKIEIEGENSAQFINCASTYGVRFWNLYWKNGAIYCNVFSKNFIKLFNIRHKKHCKIKIVKKYGLFNKIKKHKNRAGLYLGLVLFFAIICFLNNFIWIINIEGNSNISSAKISESCTEIGIKEGVLKSKINSKYDAQRLQLIEDEIAWCSFNVEGCILNVNLTETQQKEKRETPCNIKAKIDGKIKKIDVTSGVVSVNVGDVVSKGELLVSGIDKNSKSTVFLHSNGKIIAETKREFSAYANYCQTLSKETGESLDRYTINFFEIKLPLFLGNVKKDNIYTLNVTEIKLFGNKIPIKIAKEEYRFTKKINVKYTEKELEKILLKQINEQVEKFDFITIEECKKDVVKSDRGILLKITYNCTENIAVKDKILLSK